MREAERKIIELMPLHTVAVLDQAEPLPHQPLAEIHNGAEQEPPVVRRLYPIQQIPPVYIIQFSSRKSLRQVSSLYSLHLNMK